LSHVYRHRGLMATERLEFWGLEMAALSSA
jgi:hypothetical protein